ncbi:alkaline phosphatase family protein [Thermoproteus tenax]|uniref:Phosphodiesterase/nucleotide pyrophosphatase, AP superfamily n=1 Tax=Thermoproteus tenax (strain ATCC 35583 / DSM 2078 / JCM 9277 / NBRC 100435 / Kra 1) TaxID=768679 RepID=G4RQ79_THETK|nr:alkaline phosphatase family protein [Thermoproteus tenax]CCC80716.1 phosphodiesterase/nucleotide pyrophosphatase, AP superfamily [Thermoproteus tenax Kra 1]
MQVPNYSGLGLSALPNTLLERFGATPRGPTLARDLGLGKSVALVLLDGLGFSSFDRHASELAGHLRAVYRITSVFPTTTSVALTTLSTGLTPCEHGIVAWSFYLKEAGAVIDSLNMSPILGERDALNAAGYDLRSLFNAPTIFRELARQGVRTRAFLPRGLSGGISRVLYDGTEVFEYVSVYDAFVGAGRLLRDGPSYVYIYIPTIDSVFHKYGPESEEGDAAVRGLLEEVVELSRRYMAAADVIITADHGHEEITKNISLRDGELLESLIMPPHGDPRAVFLRTRGEAPDLGKFGSFELIDRESAVKAGLFGVCNGRFLERIGDYIALPSHGLAAMYLYKPKNEDPLKFKGHHGGLSESELFVPLLLL